MQTISKVNGGQNGCEEARLDTDRPDETDPTNPTHDDREHLLRCYALHYAVPVED